ncbi:hypothetical protein ACT9XH_01810 [Methanococcoides methylutens]|uniref:hypothetical protein n=1 Tax=Methanococcoides methylutens TaxID=2226 RepID=UPI004044DE08
MKKPLNDLVLQLFCIALLNELCIKKKHMPLEYLGDKNPDLEYPGNGKTSHPVITEMYSNKTKFGGRPKLDEIIMLK